MERATWKSIEGEYVTTDIEARCECTKHYGVVKGNMVDKLGAYEDTELTPEEVEIVIEQFEKMSELTVEAINTLEIAESNYKTKLDELEKENKRLTNENKELIEEQKLHDVDIEFWIENSDYWCGGYKRLNRTVENLNLEIENLISEIDSSEESISFLKDLSDKWETSSIFWQKQCLERE